MWQGKQTMIVIISAGVLTVAAVSLSLRRKSGDAGTSDPPRPAETQRIELAATPSPQISSASQTHSEETPASSLSLGCESPAHLLIVDASGKRLGGDPIAHKFYDEIPNATYESAGILDVETGATEESPPKSMYIPDPLPKAYELTVFSERDGTYSCQVEWNRNNKFFRQRMQKIPMRTGQVQRFRISFTEKPAPAVAVGGGFEGNPRTGLISYAAPLTANPSTSDGKLSFIVFYDPAILAGTFTATLNGTSISNLFDPKPGTWQAVEVPIGTAAELVLTVSGAVRGSPETDTFQIRQVPKK